MVFLQSVKQYGNMLSSTWQLTRSEARDDFNQGIKGGGCYLYWTGWTWVSECEREIMKTMNEWNNWWMNRMTIHYKRGVIMSYLTSLSTSINLSFMIRNNFFTFATIKWPIHGCEIRIRIDTLIKVIELDASKRQDNITFINNRLFEFYHCVQSPFGTAVLEPVVHMVLLQLVLKKGN